MRPPPERPPPPPLAPECTQAPVFVVDGVLGLALVAASIDNASQADLDRAMWLGMDSHRTTQERIGTTIIGLAVAAPFLASTYYGATRTRRCAELREQHRLLLMSRDAQAGDEGHSCEPRDGLLVCRAGLHCVEDVCVRARP